MTKKVIKKFGAIDENMENTKMEKNIGEMPKKGRSKISQKIWPSVSEVLDPQVCMITFAGYGSS